MEDFRRTNQGIVPGVVVENQYVWIALGRGMIV